jgi:hypothetical protein
MHAREIRDYARRRALTRPSPSACEADRSAPMLLTGFEVSCGNKYYIASVRVICMHKPEYRSPFANVNTP